MTCDATDNPDKRHQTALARFDLFLVDRNLGGQAKLLQSGLDASVAGATSILAMEFQVANFLQDKRDV